MRTSTAQPGRPATSKARSGRTRPAVLASALLAAAAATGWLALTNRAEGPAATDRAIVAPQGPALASAASTPGDGLFSPHAVMGSRTATRWNVAPVLSAFRFASPPSVATASISRSAGDAPLPPSASLDRPLLARAAPIPVPRPAEMRPAEIRSAELAPKVVRGAERRHSRRARVASVPAPVEDNRSFFDKLLGIQPPTGPALAYAALDTGPLAPAAKPRLGPAPDLGGRSGAAIYDISARVVYLPNGERLEAHSGLREKIDDPSFVHLRMRGATPPGTYDLTEREQLFHGVRALRLNPVGGSGAVFGRSGLLAHTFMLGPNGDSNGCVSFKDYARFLQAFLNGEIRQLVVVSGRGQDVPSTPNRRFGRAGQPEDRASQGG